jgi:microcystin-dependent protein
MPVPVIFSTFPGGSSIPLADLDLNFAYLTASPAFTGSISVGGNLTVGGSSNFVGPITANDLTVNGSLTIDGVTVNPTGVTGTGLLVLNNGPTLVAPILGTPASGNLTNCTGYQVNQIAGMATGVIPFLTNPTTANLAAAVVDETGTGNLVLSNNPTLTSPTLVTPILGTPASGNLSNCTGYNAANLSGVTPVANGGTGMSTTGGVGDVITVTAPGVLGYAPAPPASGVAGGIASQLLYQSAPNITSFVPNGSAGNVLISNGAATPSWGLVNATTTITGVLPVANGGTGLSSLGTGVATALATPVDTTNGFVTYPNGVVPAGAVFFFAMVTAPAGYLVANGAAVSRTTYANLFAAIGTLYGPGDGTTTFNLPNLNGQFLRGWDSSGSVDPGRTFGSNQGQSFASHTHTATVTDPGHFHETALVGGPPVFGAGSIQTGIAGAISTTLATTLTQAKQTGISVANANAGGSETRPVNVALLACIKW